MRKMGFCAALVITALGLIGTQLSANPMTTSSQGIFFKLDTTQAYIKYTVSDTTATNAVLRFTLSDTITSHSGLTLERVVAYITFDRTKLEFRSAVKSASAAFTGFAAPIRQATSGNIDSVALELYNGTGVVPTSYQEMAILTFRPLCQNEGGSNAVAFSRDLNVCFIALAGQPLYGPASGNFIDGRITVPNYLADFALTRDTVVGGVGQIVAIPVTATTTDYTNGFKHFVYYDGYKLRIDSITYLPEIGYVYADYYGDTLTLLVSSLYMRPFSGDTLYTMWFTTLCDLPNGGTFLPFAFKADSCRYYPSYCNMNPGPTYTNGGVTLEDHVSLSATLGSNPGVRKSSSGNVLWNINLINSYAAGVGNVADTGIAFNINTTSNNLYVHPTTPVNSSTMKWHSPPAVSGQYGNLYQEYGTQGETNCLSQSATPQTMLTLKTVWDPSGYTPSWSNRFIRPAFVNTFNGNHRNTVVTDCRHPQCFRATSSNNLLTYGAFADSLEVIQAEFSAAGYNSTNSCTYLDIKARNNFDLDDFQLDVTITNGWCINSVYTYFEGISYTFLSSNVIRFTTIANFGALDSSVTPVTFARINVGTLMSCPQKATHYYVTATLSNDVAFESGSQQFSTKVNGVASAKCTPPGDYCCSAPGDPGDPKAESDDGLPREFALDQNYPNPFNPITTISLDLPKASDWTITVFNITGQVVKAYSGYSGPGRVQVEFDGSQVASGVYLYRAEAGEFAATKKMVLMK
jgi:hypothetical protein